MSFQSNLCEHIWAPFATSVTTATVAAILSIITVPGNLLICWTVIWNPTRNLKSPFNYLVLNLAIADLIIGAVTEPVFVGYHLREALKHQVLGLRWVVYMSYFMSSTASVLSVVALAINRYQLTSNNLTQQWKLTSVAATSALLWLFSLGLPLLYFAVGFYKLAFIFANAAVVVSIVVLVFVYHRIYRNLRRHGKHTEHIRSSSEREKRIKQEEKMTTSFLLIIISFLTCAVPSLIMIYVINLCNSCSCVLIHWFRDLQYQFLLINSASNQFLYAWRMRSFRKAFQTIPAINWGIRTFGRSRVHGKSAQLDGQRDQTTGPSGSGSAGKEFIAQSSIETNGGGETMSLALEADANQRN